MKTKSFIILFIIMINFNILADTASQAKRGSPTHVITRKPKKKNTGTLKDRNHLFIGYTITIPKQFIGLNIFSTFPKKIGLYLDFKFSNFISTSDYFYDNISVHKAEEIFGDRKTSTSTDWFSFNVGITKVLFKSTLIYSGVGYTSETNYNQYYDEFEILGNNGKYWIESSDNSGINFFGGFMFMTSPKVILQTGFSTYPLGLCLGICFSIRMFYDNL